MNLQGKTAIVTGASSPDGVGGETAKALAARGCNVAVNYARNRAGADAVVAACAAHGVDAFAFEADVARDADCRRLAEAAHARWGHLDILINNAAVTRPIALGALEDLDAAEFHRLYDVNLIGPFQMARAAAPHLRATGDAAIVNISSVAGITGNGSSIAYAASKGALNTLTLSLARVLAPQVRVNAICPGGLFGNWTKKLMSEDMYRSKLHEAETSFPLKRGVWPSDVARQVIFLVADATTMTGELMQTDSGRHLY
ncbi:SDR family NAD(P)-dependent oxidoreductase [Roseixanthobacter glucoisosaccharinicivorans]|uniref:SDR family NAD(P)-dependent oxidoreductase n=1 Tax=Roseixanthobacter glucoisosaccharinicivorans TaxID=3119923 RepID=UPI00372CAE72